MFFHRVDDLDVFAIEDGDYPVYSFEVLVGGWKAQHGLQLLWPCLAYTTCFSDFAENSKKHCLRLAKVY